MIKKAVIAALLMLSPLFFLSSAVLADVILEPPDSFYNKHRDECTYLNRRYYANGKKGYISLKSEPGSDREVAVYANGAIINISFTYGKGANEWGVIIFDTEDKQYDQWGTGWVPMSELAIVYDTTAFEEDHKAQIYDAALNADSLFLKDEIIFWTWPGSGEIAMKHSVPAETEQRDLELGWLSATRAYKDGEGREWGYISYFYSARGTWVCFGDSANSEIPAFNAAPDPHLLPAADPGALPKVNNGLPIQAIVLLVGATIAGTAVLIRRIF